MKKRVLSLLLLCMVVLPFTLCVTTKKEPVTAEPVTPPVTVTPLPVYEPTPDYIEEELYFDSLDLLASCVEAEAGNQGLEGKRYVVDVILNRVDSPDFPDTIEDVIYQKNAFAVVTNGAIDRVTISEETYEAVNLELENRLNYEILYFTSEGFHPCGTAWRKIGDHYFSTK